MSTLREAAQQVLEACTDAVMGWQSLAPLSVRSAAMESLDALRDALAQEEQEPVAWRYQNSNTDHVYLVWEKGTGGRNWTPLYIHPPRRTGLPHCERSCEANAFQIEIRRLKAELAAEREAIGDEYSSRLQSDLENGVRWLNENAASEFNKKYPQLAGFNTWLNKRDGT